MHVTFQNIPPDAGAELTIFKKLREHATGPPIPAVAVVIEFKVVNVKVGV